MLYVNDELISTGNRNKDYKYAEIVEDYHKTIKENRDYYGDFLNIETSIRPRKDKKTRALRYPGPRGLLLVSSVNRARDDGSVVPEQLRYSPVILRKGDGGELIHESPNLLIHKGVFSIKIVDNQDLAYFVLKSGKVGKTAAEGKKFHLYDSKEIHKANHDYRKTQGQLLNLIYTSLSEDKLRTLAKSFGVGDVNLKGVEAVREELFDRLNDAEGVKKKRPGAKVRGFKEFIESSEVKMHDKIFALCTDARDQDSLVFNADERRWELDYKDGHSPYILKELANDEFGDPLGSLVNFLVTEQNSLRKIESVMGTAPKEKVATVDDDPTVDPPPKEEPEKPEVVEFTLTPEMILKEHKVPVLKKWLKTIDPEFPIKQNAKGEQLRKELLTRIPTE